MKRQHILGLLACAAILLLIGFAVATRSVVSRSVVKKISEVQLSQLFQVHVEKDSLFVDGATCDSVQFALPLTYKVPLPEKYDNSDGESFRENRLKNPRRVRLDFTEQIKSYDVQVILHPDEHDDSVGMAEWTFSKDGNMVKIMYRFQLVLDGGDRRTITWRDKISGGNLFHQSQPGDGPGKRQCHHRRTLLLQGCGF